MTSNEPLPLSVEAPRDVTFVRPQVGAGSGLGDLHRRRFRWGMRSSEVVVVGLLGFAFLMIDLHPMYHSDVWGHMTFGRWIVSHNQLPQWEPFTPFADKAAPYVNFQWLSQSLLYLIFRAGERVSGGDEIHRTEGGVELLRAFHATVEVGRFVLLLVAFRRKSGSAGLACAFLVVAVLLASHGHLAILRPQIVGELFFAGLLAALSRPVLSGGALLALPLLMVVWANAHGSFTIGLALLGLCLAGRVLDVFAASIWDPRAVWSDPQIRRLLIILVTSALAIAILNPHGPSLYWETVKLARHPNIASQIEWGPLEFDLRSGWHWNYLVLLALVAGVQALNRRWFPASDYLLLVSFGLPPLFQQRMMVWWMMVAPWVVIPHCADIAQRIRGGRPERPANPNGRKTLIAFQLLIATALLSAPVRWLVSGRPEALENSAYNATPWQVVAELHAPPERRGKWLPELASGLREYYPEAQFRGTIFSSALLGDYLVWGLAPETPIIAYSHAHLFPPTYWLQFRMAKLGMAGCRRFLDSCDVNLVVLEAEIYPDLRGLLTRDPDWLIVLDETGSRIKPNRRGHLLVALRKKPRW